MTEQTLLINGAFALRQVDGIPVFTEEKRFKKLTDQQIKNVKDKIKKKITVPKLIIKKHEYKNQDTPDKLTVKVNTKLDLHTVKQIVITPRAKGYISTAFIDYCIGHRVRIYWIDSGGLIQASFMPTHYVKQSLVMKQCKATLTGKNIEIAKYLIGLKIIGENNSDLLPKLKKAKTIKNIIAVEGESAVMYMKKWEFDDVWKWKGRHGKNPMNNSYALDPINSSLNFGYSILTSRMSEILLKRGFELSIGFLHHGEEHSIYWNRLSQDFIEPYRKWIDDTVKKMIVKKEIEVTDFTFSKDKKSMVFKDKSFKIALDRFLETLKPLEHKSLPVIRTVEKML